jgi:DNA-binding response OmpR family regulator
MYEAIVRGDEMKLKESKHIILKSLYKSPHSIYERSILIDVVSEEYFDSYQELVRNDISALEQAIHEDSKLISGRITEIVSLLESATKGK